MTFVTHAWFHVCVALLTSALPLERGAQRSIIRDRRGDVSADGPCSSSTKPAGEGAGLPCIQARGEHFIEAQHTCMCTGLGNACDTLQCTCFAQSCHALQVICSSSGRVLSSFVAAVKPHVFVSMSHGGLAWHHMVLHGGSCAWASCIAHYGWRVQTSPPWVLTTALLSCTDTWVSEA